MARERRDVTLQDFYNVALFWRSKLKERKNVKWFDSWPATASEFHLTVSKNLFPDLFNFITWVLGFSDKPEQSSYIHVDEADKMKIFSVCQDLIHIFSHISVQTPSLYHYQWL